jgi:hypothetical protein
MKTTEITVYEFDELDTDVQNRIANEYIDSSLYYWDETVRQRAKDVGLIIDSYDLDRYELELKPCYSPNEIADKIIMEYGKDASISILSQQFLDAKDLLVKKYSDGINQDRVSEENEYDFDLELDELEDDYKQELAGEYISELRNEYEFLTSFEYAREMLNDYQFTEDGQIID